MNSFYSYMKRCRELALEAKKFEESPVGAMVIKDDKIIAEAHESSVMKKDVTRHAEIEAVTTARNILGQDLSGCTLITTHEPCVMCSYAIRFYGITRVVYDEATSYLGGINSEFPVLSTKEVPENWKDVPEIITYDSKK